MDSRSSLQFRQRAGTAASSASWSPQLTQMNFLEKSMFVCVFRFVSSLYVLLCHPERAVRSRALSSAREQARRDLLRCSPVNRRGLHSHLAPTILPVIVER